MRAGRGIGEEGETLGGDRIAYLEGTTGVGGRRAAATVKGTMTSRSVVRFR